MKRIIACFLAILMVLGFFGCKHQETTEPDRAEQTQPQETDVPGTDPPETEPETGSAAPLLYRVSDKAGNVLWLFGSIHVGREDYFPLPGYVMNAYNGSDALAVEFDLVAYEKDLAAQIKTAQAMVYTDGTDITDHISEELYGKAVSIMEGAGLYNAALDYCLPVMWYSTINSLMMMEADAQTDLGIDRYFLELAKKEKKEILEVESAQFQMELLAGLSQQLQIYLLDSIVQAYGMPAVMKMSLKLLMDAWASGNEASLTLYLNQASEIPQEEAQLYEEFNNALVVTRNEAMTQWAEDTLRSGREVFMVVGAAHIVGEGALAEKLRELGYTVEIVR